MKRSPKVRMVLDMVMIIMLPMQMAYSLIGEVVHEYSGMVMFLFFVCHHLLNGAWWRNLFKGRYTAARVLGIVINLLLVVIMAALPVSGILMSRHAFSFLKLNGASYARTIHLLAAYWGFALMSFHVGLHGRMFLNMAEKAFQISKTSKCRSLVLRTAAVGISVYSVYAFIHRQLADYMFLKMQFVFFDFSEPLLFFIADYISIMLLFAFIGYYLLQLSLRRKHNIS